VKLTLFCLNESVKKRTLVSLGFSREIILKWALDS
jgi:hypothetical protein